MFSPIFLKFGNFGAGHALLRHYDVKWDFCTSLVSLERGDSYVYHGIQYTNRRLKVIPFVDYSVYIIVFRKSEVIDGMPSAHRQPTFSRE